MFFVSATFAVWRFQVFWFSAWPACRAQILHLELVAVGHQVLPGLQRLVVEAQGALGIRGREPLLQLVDLVGPHLGPVDASGREWTRVDERVDGREVFVRQDGPPTKKRARREVCLG